MQVAILGPLEVTQGAQPVEVNGARLRALLARLALDPGRVLTPDTLVASLWEDDEPSDAANALQSLVSRLRRVLPDDRLQSRPGGYVLDVHARDVDATRFEELARTGRARLRDGDAAAAAEILREALALWRGPALADVATAPFASAPATRLDELRRAAVEDRIEADLALDRHADVVPELEALLADHPLRERLTVLLVTALAGSGRSAEALGAYERTRSVLAEELGSDPSPALQSLHAAVLRGEVAAPAPPPPAAVAPVRPRSNLPSALTSFIGREVELDRITSLLSEHRLVTLVGPGGAGKTRLGCESAARAAGGEPAWLVELAPVTDAGDIAQAALGVLDLRESNVLDTRRTSSTQDALERLVAALRTGPALLVLDNCEHLIEGAARFADHLLTHCPQLRIVATSREPLGITGEMLCPLPPLGQPALDASPAEAAAHPAIRLFTDRAVAVAPDFVLDEENVAAVVEVCRRLDGLPLAIELAAARLRTLTPADLAARLDDRFRLLTGGSRTAVARHRTLHAVVEWSWDLLDDPERRLLEVMAVFPAGATADAIHSVLQDLGISELDADGTEDLLDELATKSLLQVGTSAQGSRRFRMLETIREFGVEQLAETGDVAAARRAHARYYRDLAENAEPLLRTREQLHWIAVLDQERDNLLAALRFAADDDDADTAVRIGAALAWYWWTRGSHAEVTMWLGVALAVDGPSTDEARIVAIVVYAMSGWESGQFAEQSPPAIELLTAMPSLDPLAGHPVLAIIGPVAAMLRGDMDEAESLLDQNLRHPDPWSRATLHMLRGRLLENNGDIAGERAEFERALALYEEVGERWGLGTMQAAVGELRELDGDLDGAHAAFDAAIAYADEIRAVDDKAQMLARLALIDLRRGSLDEAIAHAADARERAAATGSPQALALIDGASAAIALSTGDLDEARRHLTNAASRFPTEDVGPAQLHAAIAAGLCAVEVADGDLDAARRYLADAVRIAVEEKDMPVVSAVAAHAAELALAEDDPDAAVELLGATIAIRGAYDRTEPVARRARQRLHEERAADTVDDAIEVSARRSREDAVGVLTAFAERASD